MALNKEIWISQIKENYYPDGSFLKHVTDLSAFADGSRLHVPSSGIDPEVFINNTTYPISVEQRSDIDNSFALDRFETANGIVTSAEKAELAYDKLESIIRQYRAVLQTATAKKAIHAYAPNADTSDTPVVSVTGTATGGRKTLSIDDILTLKERFDEAQIDPTERVLVLHPKHVSDLLRADTKLFKDITDFKNGEPYKFAGFACFTFAFMPLYRTIDNVLTKLQFGAESVETDLFASVAFQSGEVFKADGDIDMFISENEPSYRGTIVGFEKRFIAMPIRGKGVGALVSATE